MLPHVSAGAPFGTFASVSTGRTDELANASSDKVTYGNVCNLEQQGWGWEKLSDFPDRL